MSATHASLAGNAHAGGRSSLTWLGDYFWSDNRRRVQTVLGLTWLLDGGLQFQGFMYSHGFTQMIEGNASGQPGWLHDSIIWAAKIANGNLAVWNTLFALTQVLLGVGLLYRPSVKPALTLSFAWALVVWWFGEGFGMMFASVARPLTGAPGGVLTYALVGLIAWPNGKAGGLLGIRGAKIMWTSVAAGWKARIFLAAAIVLNLIYWVIPQGFGGIFAGGATDPNSGPLFILLACAMMPLVEGKQATR